MNKNKIIESFNYSPTFVDILEKQIEISGNKKAFTFLTNNGNDIYTFAELGTRIRRLASLLQKYNLQGERALLLYPPGMEYIIGYFACLYAGVIAVPVYPPDPSRLNKTLPRLQSIVIDAKAKIALSTQNIVDDVEKWKQMLSGHKLDNDLSTNFEQIKSNSSRFDALFNLQWIATDNITETLEEQWKFPDINQNSIAYLQYTSGSTGTPKGVIINHENLLHNTNMIFSGFGLNTHDYEGVIWLPIYHDMGLIGGILEPIFSGFHCTLLSPLDFLKRPLRWLQIISDKKDKDIVSGGPNFAYDLCLRATTPQKRETLNLSNWKVAFTGAEPVRAETINEFSKAFKVSGFQKRAFYPCYGLAEGTLIVSGGKQEEEPIELTIDKEELKKNKAVIVEKENPNKIDFVSSGREILDGKIRIVNPETKSLCEEGEIGEVWASSKSNAQGYWGKPEVTEETFKAFIADTDDGPFMRTGDLGFKKDNELYITGRLKDLIIIRGSNHYPQDIEFTVENSNKLLRPGSTAAFSVDVAGEEQLVVVAEARAKKNVDWHKVISEIKNAIFDVHNIIPYAIVLIQPKTIFKTSSGKIRRNATKDAYLKNELEIVYDSRRENVVDNNNVDITTEEEIASTQNSIELSNYYNLLKSKIAKLKNIQKDQIDIKKPFAEFGIDSAKAVGMVGELEEELNTTLPATLLWDYPSIEKLSLHLANLNKDKKNVRSEEVNIKNNNEPIAVIGIGCKFPDAENPDEYWTLLINGQDAIHEVPLDRWNNEEYYSKEITQGKMNTKWGGFIKDVDKFDPAFFGIAPRETEHMDPQQRLLLEVTWQAFENAGILPENILGTKTGVFVGIGNQDYSKFNIGNIEELSSYTGTGNALCIAANRISYLMDFTGPSLAIDTACSSSLVSVHMAAKSLQNGESNLAVAGGVNLILTPDVNIALSQAQMMSPDGRCKTFDESANGYVRSEGCGIVILKRLSDAEKDGNNILAIIKGSAVNQDGRSNGLTAPNRLSQEKVIHSALHDAKISPNEIDYIETHGTGTSLGDPIEVQALTEVFGNEIKDKEIILGAVKSNIGHLETAAGIAGLIKVVLSLKNKFIPRNINFNRINPLIPIEKIPFKIPTENIKWKTHNLKRIAGVSSFGFGGTNAHVILEEYLQKEIKKNNIKRPLNILTVSAKDEDVLEKYISTHHKYITEKQNIDLTDYCYTANTGRAVFENRAAFVFKDKDELLEKLKDNSPDSFSNNQILKEIKVAFLFTGQGAQYIKMGEELYKTEPAFKKEFDKCNEILNNYLEHSLFDVVFNPEKNNEEIHNTAYTQPALFAVEYSLAKLWQSWGANPDYMIGHSVGEYVAAVLADVMSLEDGLKLIAARGRLMQSLPQDGEMVAVFDTEKNVKSIIAKYTDKVSIAGINGPNNIVVSGERNSVKEIVSELEKKGIKVTYLKVSHAFHSPLMNPILNEFEKIANEIKFNKAAVPFVSNLTGNLIDTEKILDAKYWSEHIREAVQFNKGMKTLASIGVDVFLEIGPHPVLTGMGQGCLPDSKALWLPSLRRKRNDWEIILQSLANLYTFGYKINWKNFNKDYGRKYLFIPTYPFKKERYWLENSSLNKKHNTNYRLKEYDFEHPLLHKKIDSPFIDKIVYETLLNENSLSIIKDHKIFGMPLLPATAFAELSYAAATKTFGTDNILIENLKIFEGIVFDKSKTTNIQIAFDKLENGKGEFQIFSRNENTDWLLNATGYTKIAENAKNSKIEISNIIERCTKFNDTKLENFYNTMNDHGFQHADSMRLIKELWHSENEAIGLFEIKEKNLDEVENYLLHPSLTDAGTQLFAAMLSEHSDIVNGNGIYLPVEIEKFRIYKNNVSKVWGYVTKPENLNKKKVLKSNITLLEKDGTIVAEIIGIQYKFTTFEILSKLLLKDTEKWIYKFDWIRKDIVNSATSLEGLWLIFEDKAGLSKKIKTAIESKGGETLLFNHNSELLTTENNEKLDALFSLLKNEKQKSLKGIIYLPSLDYKFIEEPDTEELIAQQKKLLGKTLQMLQSLASAGFLTSPKVLLLTNNVQHNSNNGKKTNLIQAPLIGLSNVAHVEFPELQFVTIDIDNLNSDKIADILSKELLSEDNETQISYNKDERLVARITSSNQEGEIRNQQTPQRLEIHEKGILDNIKLVPLKREEPAEGEVEIRVYATGLNFRDVLNALDLYPGDPGLLGGECSGIITAVGKGVNEFKIGDKVLGVASGSFATHVVTNENLIVHKPENISFEEAASVPIVYLTAYYTLHKLANVQKGESVLIHAATGGVGLAAIQVAKMLGAKIFGTAGNDTKRSVLSSEGVELIMDSRSLDFAEQVMEYTEGSGVDVILNSFSGKYIEKGLSILSKNGRFLEIGKRGIWNHEKVKNFRKDIEYFTIAIDDISEKNPKLIKNMLLDIIENIENGKLTPIRNEIFPLEDAVQVFRYMRRAKHIGKLILNQKIEDKKADNKNIPQIIPDATYLITGGRGALGLLVAKWLINKGAKNLILAGRSEPNESVKLRIAELIKTGANIILPNVDVSDFKEMKNMFNKYFGDKSDLPQLKGIIHAAGVLDDGIILQQSWERFDKVFKPKVRGAWNLHLLTKQHSLDFMIYFSSVASIFGSPGQANYAAANSFMDILASYRRKNGLPAQSINWGPWDSDGMAEKSNTNKNGINKITPFQGLYLLDKMFDKNHIQAAVVSINWEKFSEQLFENKNIPLFEYFVITKEGSKKKTTTIPRLIGILEKVDDDKKINVIKEFLSDNIKKVLGMNGTQKLNTAKPLSEMGIDSLMGLEIKKIIDNALGKNLPATLVFNYPTIDALANYILSDVLNLSDITTEENEIGQDEQFDEDTGIKGIEDLSEEEAEALLLEKLNANNLDELDEEDE